MVDSGWCGQKVLIQFKSPCSLSVCLVWLGQYSWLNSVRGLTFWLTNLHVEWTKLGYSVHLTWFRLIRWWAANIFLSSFLVTWLGCRRVLYDCTEQKQTLLMKWGGNNPAGNCFTGLRVSYLHAADFLSTLLMIIPVYPRLWPLITWSLILLSIGCWILEEIINFAASWTNTFLEPRFFVFQNLRFI